MWLPFDEHCFSASDGSVRTASKVASGSGAGAEKSMKLNHPTQSNSSVVTQSSSTLPGGGGIIPGETFTLTTPRPSYCPISVLNSTVTTTTSARRANATAPGTSPSPNSKRDAKAVISSSTHPAYAAAATTLIPSSESTMTCITSHHRHHNHHRAHPTNTNSDITT